MAQGDVFINSTLIPKSTLKVTKGRINFETKERTVNGTLVSDYVATKHTRVLFWENFLDEDFVDVMIALFLTKADVTYREVNSDLTEISYTMSMGISEEIIREYDEGSYAYSGFTISLEEV